MPANIYVIPLLIFTVLLAACGGGRQEEEDIPDSDTVTAMVKRFGYSLKRPWKLPIKRVSTPRTILNLRMARLCLSI